MYSERNLNYKDVYWRALVDSEMFWSEAAQETYWIRQWDKVLDGSNKPFYRWFAGGIVNTCYNAVDYHVQNGRADQLAVIYDSPVTGNTVCTYTYRELRDAVAKFGGVLAAQGVGKGDRVIIYMPMVPEALIAILACARIGVVHSVVFNGFAAHELSARIDDVRPKVLISASCGIEVSRVIDYKYFLDGSIGQAEFKPEKTIILQRPQKPANLKRGYDLDWEEAMASAKPVDCVPVAATDPLCILYTSDFFGKPKGIVRDNGGHLVALKWTMKNIYDIEPGDVWWAASDVGWGVGHSYIVYAPLFRGSTTVVYEGKPVGTPDAGAFWRVISDYKVKCLFTAPTALRAIKRKDPRAELMKKYDLSQFKSIFLAGERADPDTREWAQNALNRPVIDQWCEIETGWVIAATCMGLEPLPMKPGSPTKPLPGWDVHVLNNFNVEGVPQGEEVPRGQIGSICVKLPLPPGALSTLWNNDKQFVQSYLTTFPGYYETKAVGFMDEDGYVYIMHRTHDLINVAGHCMSPAAMESVLIRHRDVAECVVVAVANYSKGEVPLGLVVLNYGVDRPHEEIVEELVQMILEVIGPVSEFEDIVIVDRLPKTRSGRYMSGITRKIVNNKPWKMPALIEDPAILGEIAVALEEKGYGRALKEGQ